MAEIELTPCYFSIFTFVVFGEVIDYQRLCSEVHPESCHGEFPREFYPEGCPWKNICGPEEEWPHPEKNIPALFNSSDGGSA